MLVPADCFSLNTESSPLVYLTLWKFYSLRGGCQTGGMVFPQSCKLQRDAFLSGRRQSDGFNPFSPAGQTGAAVSR